MHDSYRATTLANQRIEHNVDRSEWQFTTPFPCACALCTLRLPRLFPRAFLSSWFRLVTPYAVNTCHVWTRASLTLAVVHVRTPATASPNNRKKERNWRNCSANKPVDPTTVSLSFYSREINVPVYVPLVDDPRDGSSCRWSGAYGALCRYVDSTWIFRLTHA